LIRASPDFGLWSLWSLLRGRISPIEALMADRAFYLGRVAPYEARLIEAVSGGLVSADQLATSDRAQDMPGRSSRSLARSSFWWLSQKRRQHFSFFCDVYGPPLFLLVTKNNKEKKKRILKAKRQLAVA
jgi:hypothetical protein